MLKKMTADRKTAVRLVNRLGALALCGLLFGQMESASAQETDRQPPATTPGVPNKPRRASEAFWNKDARLTTTRLTIAPDVTPTISAGSALFRQIQSDAKVRVSTDAEAAKYSELPLVIGASDVSCAALLDAIGAFYMGDWERMPDKSYAFLPPLLLPKASENDALQDAVTAATRSFLDSLKRIAPEVRTAMETEDGIAYGRLPAEFQKTLVVVFAAMREQTIAYQEKPKQDYPAFSEPTLDWDGDVRISIVSGVHRNPTLYYKQSENGALRRSRTLQIAEPETERREANARQRQERTRRAMRSSFHITTKFELRNDDAKSKRPELQQRVTLPLMKQTTPADVMIALHKLYPKIAFICKPATVSISNPVNGKPLRADIVFDDVPIGDALDELARVFHIGWELRPMGVFVLRNPNQQSRYLPLSHDGNEVGFPP